MNIKGFEDTIAWYNDNAEKYAAATAEFVDREQIADFVTALFPGARVLDAGCGSGRDTNALVESGLDTVGLDYSAGLVAEAKRRFPNCQFIEGSFLDLKIADETLDGIWAHASLLHLETIDDVKKALSEFHRVLKQNGVLHVLVKAQTGTEKTAVVSDSLSGHDRFFQYFTKEELTQLLNEFGFTVTLMEQYREIDRSPNGRPEVEWIISLSRKN
jgi:ubiquinone/menaquinone biosynthesis C-methylase UbiE